jgi:hypothetical protein
MLKTMKLALFPLLMASFLMVAPSTVQASEAMKGADSSMHSEKMKSKKKKKSHGHKAKKKKKKKKSKKSY